MKWYKALHIVVITLAVSATVFIGYSNYFTSSKTSNQTHFDDTTRVDPSPEGDISIRYEQKPIETKKDNSKVDRILKVVETFTPLAVPFITHYLYRRKERDDEDSNT